MIIDLDNYSEIDLSRIDDLEGVYLKGYHCTRGYTEDLKRDGLIALNPEQHLSYVNLKLSEYGLTNEELEQFNKIVQSYLSTEQLRGRRNQVCFCLNRDMFESEDGCEDFFSYFGGECIYKAFQHLEDVNKFKLALAKLGLPLVVTAKVQLTKGLEFQKDNIIKYLNGESRSHCEIFIKESISPESIINIEYFNPKYNSAA